MRWDELMTRAEERCEFCGAQGELTAQDVTPEDQVLLCPVCRGEADAPVGHWHCLEGSAWSPEPAVQIAVWKKLGELEEGWAVDTRDMMQVDPDAMARLVAADQPEIVHKDSFGMVLVHGDTVVLVKDLPVKGAGFTAKRGTAVRNISLVQDNAGHIEGRVEGQRIVILTEFVKRK
ncbi:MAG: PhnA domain-containing protein [Yoonia sp.]